MVTQRWLKNFFIHKQGSALLMVLGLLAFILALGTIVYRAAQMREELARERYAYRKAMNVLESMTSAACAAGAAEWHATMIEHPETTDIGTYGLTVDGVTYHLAVTAQQGDLLLRATCVTNRGATIVLQTRLGFDGKRAVIREQKRATQ